MSRHERHHVITHIEPYTGSNHLEVGNGKGLSISHLCDSFISTSTNTLRVHFLLKIKPFLNFMVIHVSSRSKCPRLSFSVKDDLSWLDKPSSKLIPRALSIACSTSDIRYRCLGYPHTDVFHHLFLNKHNFGYFFLAHLFSILLVLCTDLVDCH